MTLMEKLAKAKENLVAIKTAVENGEKGADELSAAIENVKSIQSKLDAAAEAENLIKSLGSGEGSAADPEEKGTAMAKTLGEHFVEFKKSHGNADNRIIATPFKAAGDPTPSTDLVPTQYDNEVVRRVAAPLTVLDLFARKSISAPVYSWNVYNGTTGSAGTTA